MIDMMACVQTNGYEMEALRRISLLFLSLSLGLWVLAVFLAAQCIQSGLARYFGKLPQGLWLDRY